VRKALEGTSTVDHRETSGPYRACCSESVGYSRTVLWQAKG